MSTHILIVDDEQPIRESLSGLFEDEGFIVSTSASGEEAVARFRKHPADCIFLDIWMPGIDGLETMARIKQIDANVPVIMMSGHATIDTAVRATRQGAFDFIEKPFSSDKLLILLRNAVEKRRLAIENLDLKFESKRNCPSLIGQSKAVADVNKHINKVAASGVMAFVLGEHGTGKSVAARLLHEGSPRSNGSFISFNSTSVNNLSLELFGFEKGAFAGALQTQRGRLEAAHMGTMFFEEIADLDIETQLELLKVTEKRRFMRLGNATPIPCDVRLVMSTLSDPDTLIKEGKLAKPLYDRLSAAVIHMPRLKDRSEDIPQLLTFLAAEQAKSLGGEPVQFDEEVIQKLQQYDWPGNVRELRNYVERCHILCPGLRLTLQTMLPLDGTTNFSTSFATVPDDSVLLDGFHDARKRFEHSYIAHHLEKNNWNVSKTATDIGMERSQLHRKIKSYNLMPDSK